MSQLFNFGLGDPSIQQWGECNYQGTVLSLSHLDAHKVQYARGNKHYDVYVTYSHHCFTKTEEGNDALELLFEHPKDPRHFHKVCYDLSLGLPGLVGQLPDLFTFHGGRKNHYCSCKVTQGNGEEVDYLIVFTMFRRNKKLRLHVTSAYPYARGKAKKVGFMKILEALHQGRKLPGQIISRSPK